MVFQKGHKFYGDFLKPNYFKKGQIPWNKGEKGVMPIPWNKGKTGYKLKPCPKETKRKIGEAQMGEKNHMWKGKEKKDIRGYLFIWKPNHLKNHYGRVQNSVLVAEKYLGRPLTKEEIVHHIGIHYLMDSPENRGDDSPENLYLFPSRSKHTQYHFKKNRIQLTSNLF